MPKKPLISIVTPTYNQGVFIEQTILSVINQTYPHKEYLIFDACSTDNTLEIIRKYQNAITYWVSEPDNGQSDAINKGWKLAKGDILFYLNSDDALYNEHVLETIAEAYMKNPDASVIYGDCAVINADNELIAHKKAKYANTKILLKNNEFGSILFQTASFFKADYVRKLNGLNVNLHYCMDYDLILRLSYLGPMYRVPVTTAYFRIHKNSKSFKGVVPLMREMLQIKWNHHKFYALKYAWHFFKFYIFLKMPIFLKKTLKPNLYARYYQ